MINNKTNCETITVDFDEFPSQPKEILYIFNQFILDSQKQAPLQSVDMDLNLIDQSDLDLSIGFRTSIPKGEHPLNWIVNHPPIIYKTGVLNGEIVTLPQQSRQVMFYESFDKSVFIDGEKYYEKCYLSHTAAGIELNIGKCLKLTIKDDSGVGSFAIGKQGRLQERIHDIKFISSLFEHKEISFGSDRPQYTIKLASINGKIDEIRSYLKFYQEIYEALTILGVNEPNLDLDSAQESDWRLINNIRKAVIKGKD